MPVPASIDALKIHPYNAPLTVAGQATGRRVVDQVPGLDTLVAVGAGTCSGPPSCTPSSVRVIAVETEACNSFHAASAARELVDVSAGVGADVGARRIGELPRSSWPARPTIVVDDGSVTDARRTCGRSTNWRWNPQRP